MKTLQEPQGTSEEVKQSSHASPNSQSSPQISPGPDALMADSDGASVPNNENNKKVSREDIELVQSLIERCLLLYMNRSEVVKILRNRAKIEPGFTSLVWQKLEEENAEFFRAYYIRLMLKKQILLFNNLLEHQYHLVNHPATPKAPLATVQNGIHLMTVNNVPMGYPVLQQPALSATAQPHLDSMGLSSCHVVNGVPAPGNFHPIRMNSGNDMMVDKTTNIAPAAAPCSAMSSMTEMAVSPASVASSGHFPFTPSDITGIGIDSSVLDSAFTTDMGTSGELQLGMDGGPGTSKDTLRSGGQLPWTLSRGKTAVEMAARDREFRVFVVAGEVSGDSIAARLMNSLRRLSPFPVRFSGVGGTLMRKEGLKSLFPMEDIAVMGIWELLPHLRKLRVKLNETVEASVLFQPHVVLTVDSKGFSFRLHRKLREKFQSQQEDCPLQIHYVAPSFWAWKGGERRLKNLPSFLDHLLCILPFEEEVFRRCGLAATFVGHPMLEDDLELKSEARPQRCERQGSGEAFLSNHGLPSGTTVITLLPGSRLQEVTRMLPIFLNTLELLKRSFPELAIVVITAPNDHVKAYIDKVVRRWSLPIILVPGASLHEKYDAFSASTAALCTSGTAVMELQLARLPCVVAYRAHILTEWLIKYRTKLKFISLSNILLESAIIPEVLFQACTPENLATALRKVICDDRTREQQIINAEKVFKIISPPERISGDLVPSDLGPSFVPHCASMNAAAAILYSARRSLPNTGLL